MHIRRAGKSTPTRCRRHWSGRSVLSETRIMIRANCGPGNGSRWRPMNTAHVMGIPALARAEDLLRRTGPLRSLLGRTNRGISPAHEGSAHGPGREPASRNT
jgi:hypothetical protein